MRFIVRMAPVAGLAAAMLITIAGCKNPASPDTTNEAVSEAGAPEHYDPGDPANANVAPVSNASDNTGAPEGAYKQPPQAAQKYQTYSNKQDPYANQQSSGTDYDNYSDYQTPVEFAPDPPPATPDYQQPPAPGDGYIWSPGYWGYSANEGYYWVPGAWVQAPYVGALWTPGWWGLINGRYAWHRGYWGRHIGYYGGINYGHGYDGDGYHGGYWKGDHFEYNRDENNVNPSAVHDVYNYRVRNENTSHVSYNGGKGIQIQPRPQEVEALHEQHNPPMAAQMQVAQQAKSNRQNYVSMNRGRPQQPVVSQPLPPDRNVPEPKPVRYSPPPARGEPQPYRGVPQEQRGPEQQGGTSLPYHAVGPEPVIPRMQSPGSPEARGGPQRYAPATPREQPRQQPQRPQQTRPQQQRQQAPRSQPERRPQ